MTALGRALRAARWALLLAVCLPAPLHAAPRAVWTVEVRVSHYWETAQPMADGDWPYIGAVACDSSIGLGSTVITPDGAQWYCADTGMLDGWGFDRVDFFGFDAEAVYGEWVTVQVVR